MEKKMKALGKVIITKIPVELAPKKKSKNELILSPELQAEKIQKEKEENSEYYCTLEVVAVGPEVREEIKPGTKVMVSPMRLQHLDVVRFNGKLYHYFLDSELTIPLIVE